MVDGSTPRQPNGEEVPYYLDHFIGGKMVRVDAYGHDRYKRILAEVWDGQVNVNQLMVAIGDVEVYRGGALPALLPGVGAGGGESAAGSGRSGGEGNRYGSPTASRRRMQLTGESGDQER